MQITVIGSRFIKEWYIEDDKIIYGQKVIPIVEIEDIANFQNDTQEGHLSILWNGKREELYYRINLFHTNNIKETMNEFEDYVKITSTAYIAKFAKAEKKRKRNRTIFFLILLIAPIAFVMAILLSLGVLFIVAILALIIGGIGIFAYAPKLTREQEEALAVYQLSKGAKDMVKANKDASVVKNAVIGGVIAGPTGAVVGALSAVDKNNRKANKKK